MRNSEGKTRLNDMDIKWDKLRETLNNFADYFIQSARNNLSDNNTNASFALYNSFEKIIEIGDDWFSVKISLEDYWRYVEEGTGPAHVPDARAQYWPKIQPLIDWVQHKEGLPQVEGFAYAVRGKIHKEGTEPQPFFEPAKQDAIARFELAIDLAIAEDVDNYVLSKVDEYLLKTFKEL